eukprot:scaffold38358_cov70-Phaeocystis_antarctica.AAC.3
MKICREDARLQLWGSSGCTSHRYLLGSPERAYQHGQASELVSRGLPVALRVDQLAVLLHHLLQRLLDLLELV